MDKCHPYYVFELMSITCLFLTSNFVLLITIFLIKNAHYMLFLKLLYSMTTDDKKNLEISSSRKIEKKLNDSEIFL